MLGVDDRIVGFFSLLFASLVFDAQLGDVYFRVFQTF